MANLLRPRLKGNTFGLTVLSASAVIVFGMTFSYWMASSEDTRMREELLIQARITREAMDLEKIARLQGSSADLDTPDYQQIKDQLSRMRSTNPEIRFIYLMGRRPDGVVYFFVDSESADSKDYSPPGQSFDEANAATHQVFISGREVVDGPTTDRWGTWVSALTPLLDPRTGELLAVVGMDVDSRHWQRRVILYSATPVSIAILLALLLAVYFVFYQRADREKQLLATSEAALRKYEHIVSGNRYFMSFLDRNYTFQVINDAYLKAFNKPREAIIGHTLAELYGEEFFQTNQKQPFDQTLAGHVGGYETWFDLPVHGRRYLRIDYTPFYEGDLVTGVIVNAHDLTKRKMAEEAAQMREEKIRNLAYHDVLTELPNRTLFLDRLSQALAQSDRDRTMVAVLFADLDRFKTINDTLGHGVGDEILRQVAVRLRKALREGDTVARFGGDEFVILLPRISVEREVTQVAIKIIDMLSSHFLIQEHDLHVTSSIGISLFPKDGGDAETLLKHADTALYKAKDQGRHQYQFFDSSMNVQAHDRLLLENSLRNAMLRGELLLYYQPQISLRTRNITGVEALLRWRHPVRGLVPPSEFIPITEETGLITDIGAWVLRTACQQAMAWQHQGLPPLKLAVNLSARQLLRRHDLDEIVKNVLKETGFLATNLELEITESSIMSDPERSIDVLRSLGQMGINLAIDDFGTGYSSLSYLKRLPLHSLKIDQSFVQSLPRDKDDVAIVHAVLAMARQLNFKVVAEGIETAEQLQFLIESGCDVAQGYFICVPLSFEDCTRFLSRPGSE